MSHEDGHCDHCFHAESTLLLTYPAQVQEVCCLCGTRRVRLERVIDAAQHGPHLPTKTVIIGGRPGNA